MAANGKPDRTFSLFLIDDHPIIKLGLSLALQGQSRLRLVGTITNPWMGLDALEAARPDAVLVDLVFDGKAETRLIRECRMLLPDALIIVFSSLPRHAYEREVTDMGADAFIGKSSDISVVIETIADMADGTRKPAPRPRPALEGLDVVIDGIHITQREAAVAKRLGAGLSISRIAADLSISPNTVSVHRDNIRKKLNCRDMTELVALLARYNGTIHDRT